MAPKYHVDRAFEVRGDHDGWTKLRSIVTEQRDAVRAASGEYYSDNAFHSSVLVLGDYEGNGHGSLFIFPFL